MRFWCIIIYYLLSLLFYLNLKGTTLWLKKVFYSTNPLLLRPA